MNLSLFDIVRWRSGLRALAVVLSVAFGCGCGLAVEKSFRIEFQCEPTTGASGGVSNFYITNNPSRFISSGYEYVSSFSNLYCIYRDPTGYGWVIGDFTDDIQQPSGGEFTTKFAEAVQVNATRVEISIIAQKTASSQLCYIIANNDKSLAYYDNVSLNAGASHTFRFDLGGTRLESLKLMNYEEPNSSDYVPYYLTAMEVFYEEEEATDPEMQFGEGSFAQSGTDFECGEGRLQFDHIVSIVNGAAIFKADNRLTVSAPEGYFLAGVEFQGASADGSITASSGTVTAGKWLPAESDIALNAVEFTAAKAESFTGVKISYLPFRIDHSLTSSTIDFAATEGTTNSINIHSSFANSGKSTVERFIIRANGVQIAETQTDAVEASFAGLPYLTDGRLTISPVINGTERQPELLEGTTLPNLGATNYSISANMLLCTPRQDDATRCDIGAVLRLAVPEDIPAALYSNFQVTVSNHPEAIIQPADGFIDIYIPTYIENLPYVDGLPDLSTAAFETFTITFTPTYQFYVAEDFRSLLAAPAANRLKVSALDSDGIQTVTYDAQQLQATFNADSSVSHIPTLTADAADTARYYTLQGIEIRPDQLTPGLYIERRGTRTALHLHR